jgi:hypothetical protein
MRGKFFRFFSREFKAKIRPLLVGRKLASSPSPVETSAWTARQRLGLRQSSGALERLGQSKSARGLAQSKTFGHSCGLRQMIQL